MKALCAVGLSALAACGGTVDLPVVQDVDVFVSGGGVAAVSAACAAKAAGARVFLAAPRPQLGEDVCGKLRLRREPGDDERSALFAEIFSPEAAPRDTRTLPQAAWTTPGSHASRTAAA